MSNDNERGPAGPPSPPLPPEPVTMLITLDPASGQVNVTGPLHDRFMCYGLLGSAMETICQMGIRQALGVKESKIVLPRFGRG